MKLLRFILALLVAPGIAAGIYDSLYDNYQSGCIYSTAYVLAIISVPLVLYLLRKCNKLTATGFCVVYMALGMLYLVAVYLSWGVYLKMVLLHRPEAILVHALSVLVFALVFWVFAYGLRFKVNRIAPQE